ncbi:Putative amidase domain-containing protein [Carboxydocella sporoproducens DSM 16521]|uniref:Amidase domain-containing protein n=2 Tax=Carboxydocella TaxID=178898 RepID=A0A2R4MYY2_CARTR|nr:MULTISPECIES: amidase domain-containing protein [Carboxydocella]AVX20014.1 Putative amidase domain-containing protein [Carboxydocella thermautotrophica]SJZ77829.1 Putative amidase domain-containing protein [Carboxydocella sporoproducens DSM 16521]
MKGGILSKSYIWAITLVVLIFIFTLSPHVHAYNSTGAVSYAEKWAKSRNSNYPSFDNDCTNFVSQAIHDPTGAGKPFDESGSSQYFMWYIYKRWWGWDYTTTWSVASHFYNYLRENPAGSWINSWNPPQPTTPSDMKEGDILFYDWNNDGSKDHAAIVVGYGTDPTSGYVGNLQDQHTTDRYHAIWHLRPYNSKWTTTVIYDMRPF